MIRVSTLGNTTDREIAEPDTIVEYYLQDPEGKKKKRRKKLKFASKYAIKRSEFYEIGVVKKDKEDKNNIFVEEYRIRLVDIIEINPIKVYDRRKKEKKKPKYLNPLAGY